MSLTTDNVRPSTMPNAWCIGRLTMSGAVMGICLLAFCTGVLAVGEFGLNLGAEALSTLAFVVLVFGSQATLYAIRQRRHLWGSRPSLWLAVSSVADIAIASTLAIGGIAMTALPAAVVAGALAAATAFAFVLDLVKVPVFARLMSAQSPHRHPTTDEASSAAKTEGASVAESSAGEPKPSDRKPEAEAETKPEITAEPKPEAKAEASPEAEPQSQANIGVAALLDTSLGELLLEGVVKDPEDAGRIIAAAITQAGASISAATPPHADAEAKPEAKAEPQPEAKATTPSDVPTPGSK